jgi:hypothetical protein
MMKRTGMRVLLGLAVLALLAPAALAQRKAVKPTKTWSGSVADEALAKDAPIYIAGQPALAKLWKAWNIEGKVPDVDFSKEIVIVAVSRGSRLNLSANIDDKGNLQVIGFGTRDLRPGFRYVIGTVSREGVKKVNGKELKDETKDKP